MKLTLCTPGFGHSVRQTIFLLVVSDKSQQTAALSLNKMKQLLKNISKIPLIFILLFFFVCSLDTLSSAFQLAGGKYYNPHCPLSELTVTQPVDVWHISESQQNSSQCPTGTALYNLLHSLIYDLSGFWGNKHFESCLMLLFATLSCLRPVVCICATCVYLFVYAGCILNQVK